MEQVKAIKLTRAEWLFLAIVTAVLGCIVTGKLVDANKRNTGYKHSLAYPQFQDRTFIQVGSLDRG